MSRLRCGRIIESPRPAPTRSRWCLLLAGFLVLWANPAAAILLESSSSLYEGAAGMGMFFINKSDPLPVHNSPGFRVINGLGSVSSEIEYSQVTDHSGPFVYVARSGISMDPVQGFSFSGDASVSSTPVGLVGLTAAAVTQGFFFDQPLISNPLLNGQRAFLLIPLHVTGAAGTIGADVVVPFNHIAQFSYSFFDSASPCTVCAGNIGLTTPDETLGQPVLFDQTVMIKLPFIFGQSFAMNANFAIDAELWFPYDPSAAPSGGSTEANFSHTVRFGAASVVDAQGNPIPGSVVLSDFNYLAGPSVGPSPVPEPWSVVLLGFGVLGISWRATRHRRSGNR